jgi:hypothetical protein
MNFALPRETSKRNVSNSPKRRRPPQFDPKQEEIGVLHCNGNDLDDGSSFAVNVPDQRVLFR